MKIPRLTSGPCCYTLEGWATRMAFSDLSLGILVGGLCFYASTLVEMDNASTAEDAEVAKGILIAIGVILCFPALFAIILLIGLWTTNKMLILIWCFYGMAGVIIFLIFFIAASIMIFIMGSIGLGFLCLAVAAILAGHLTYSVLIVYGIYLKLKEAENNYTSNAETGIDFSGSNNVVLSR